MLPNPYVQLQKTGAAACCGMLRLHMLGLECIGCGAQCTFACIAPVPIPYPVPSQTTSVKHGDSTTGQILGCTVAVVPGSAVDDNGAFFYAPPLPLFHRLLHILHEYMVEAPSYIDVIVHTMHRFGSWQVRQCARVPTLDHCVDKRTLETESPSL